ncbi:MAG: hypothetical protein V1772_00725 [Chloroflexota bacterium]
MNARGRVVGFVMVIAVLASGLLAGCGSGGPVVGLEMVCQGPCTYQDPGKLFVAPVPAGWTARRWNDMGKLSNADGKMTGYAFAQEGSDPDAAVKAGLAGIGFPLTRQEVYEIPYRNLVVITYDTGDERKFAQAYCTERKGTVYVLFFRVDVEVLADSSEPIEEILNGFTLMAVESSYGNQPRAPTTDA